MSRLYKVFAYMGTLMGRVIVMLYSNDDVVIDAMQVVTLRGKLLPL